MLEAARWASSCFNEQPWRYIVVTKDQPEEYQRMLDCLVEGNQIWVKTAPVLMISVASLHFTHNGKPNREALHDVGAASAMLTIQAMAEGLYVHQMAGYHRDKVRETYGIPVEFEPAAAIALGYPGDPAVLPEAIQQRTKAPRVRKPMGEFTFAGRWGEPARL